MGNVWPLTHWLRRQFTQESSHKVVCWTAPVKENLIKRTSFPTANQISVLLLLVFLMCFTITNYHYFYPSSHHISNLINFRWCQFCWAFHHNLAFRSNKIFASLNLTLLHFTSPTVIHPILISSKAQCLDWLSVIYP